MNHRILSFLFFIGFLTFSSSLSAQVRGCENACNELIITETDTDCPCRLDLKVENAMKIGTLDPCHCHTFRTLDGIYLRETLNRRGEIVILMSETLTAGNTLLLRIESEDINQMVEEIFDQLETGH